VKNKICNPWMVL